MQRGEPSVRWRCAAAIFFAKKCALISESSCKILPPAKYGIAILNSAFLPANFNPGIIVEHSFDQEVWERALAQLKRRVDEDSFATWLSPTRFHTINDNVVTVSVPTSFSKN